MGQIILFRVRSKTARRSGIILSPLFPQALHLIALRAAVFSTPATKSNFRRLSADRRHCFALRVQHVDLTELRDDLFCPVSFR